MICDCEPAVHPSVIGACACPVHGMKALRKALDGMVDPYRHEGTLIVEAGATPMDDALIAAVDALGHWPA